MTLNDKVYSWIVFTEPVNRSDCVVCASACHYCNVCNLTARLELLVFNVVEEVVYVVAVIVASYSDRNLHSFFPPTIDFMVLPSRVHQDAVLILKALNTSYLKP